MLGIEGVIRSNSLVILTFLMNGIIAIYNLTKEKKLGYSLDDMFWIYAVIFLFTAPLIQYLTNSFPWWNTDLLTDGILIKTNMVVLIFFGCYQLVNTFYKGLKRSKEENRQNKYMKFVNIRFILNCAFYLSILCSLYIIYKTGFNNLFSRSTNELDIQNGAIMQIVSHTFRAFPIITMALNIVYKRKYNHYLSIKKFIIITILGVLINFPTGVARYNMAMVYIGLFVLVKPYFKNKFFIKYIVIFGLLFAFPLINIFRHNSFDDLSKVEITLPNPTEDFVEGDFDSYSMLSRSIYYVDNEGSTLGRQLLGNLLFYVPRELWPNKPVGSGYFLAEELGWYFKNVSCPFIGEGYINFGLIGVIIFSCIFAISIAILSDRYCKLIEKNLLDKEVTVIEVIYPFLLGFLFFILRGDLLSTLSYMIGFIMPIILLIALDKFIDISYLRGLRGGRR